MVEAAWDLQHTDTSQCQKDLYHKMLGWEDNGICKLWLLLNEHCFTTSLSQIIPIASCRTLYILLLPESMTPGTRSKGQGEP